MPFIGKQPDSGGYQILDAMTASATASYTMQINSTNFEPGSANQLIVSLNGVIQKPGSSFTISGSTLTFSSALTSSDSIDFVLVLGDTLDIGTPSAGSTVPGNFGVAGVQTINRTGNGDLIALQKGGVDSGSISIESSGTAFDGEGSHAGLKMFASAVGSRQNGSDVDNTIDLGWTGGRFKDIYLGGGVYVGGTGSANHLDDYEEGTWTPALFGSSTAGSFSATSATGSYVKIGRFVHGFFSVQAGTLSGFGGFVRLGGFPFTAQSGGGGYLTYVEGQSFTFTSSTNNTTVFLEGSSTSANYNLRPQHAGTNYDKFVTGLTDGSIDGYYRGLIQCITTA